MRAAIFQAQSVGQSLEQRVDSLGQILAEQNLDF